jgi:hypothetical protein
VPAEHKPMYAEQMKFIGYVSGTIDGKEFHASAYDHEKFPYNAERWEEWKRFITANYWYLKNQYRQYIFFACTDNSF